MSLSPVSVLRGAWRRLPMSVRRSAGKSLLEAGMPLLSARLPKARGARAPAEDGVAVMGVFAAALGHGTAARLLTAELEAGGARVAPIDVTSLVGAQVNDPRPFGNGSASQKGALILAVNPDTALVALAGGARGLLRNRPVIGYFVWELESAPRAWASIAPALDAVWSPSRFSAAALEALYGRPVSVAPHPVALAPPPHPTAELRRRGRARIAASEEDFVAFSSMSATSSLTRKNPAGAIAAFEAAFGQDPRRVLVLRVLGGTRYPDAMHALRKQAHAAKTRVLLIEEPGGLDELHELYAACDVYLSLHRSEGFGLNLAEAMLCGRPVIATGWSGNLDFMDASSAALVDFTLTPAIDPQGVYRIKGARWAEPKLESAVAQLRRLADDPDLRAALGAAGRQACLRTLGGGAATAALAPWRRP